MTEPIAFERWIGQLRTWRFDGVEAYRDSCLLAEDSVGRSVYCRVRARWATLPLAVAGLADWEQWLSETDADTAARLVPSVKFEDDPGVAWYDRALAAFDETGHEPWRTDLMGYPMSIAVVDDVLWVNSSPDSGGSLALTGMHSSDGRVLRPGPDRLRVAHCRCIRLALGSTSAWAVDADQLR